MSSSFSPPKPSNGGKSKGKSGKGSGKGKGGRGGGKSAPRSDETELSTRTINIEGKRYNIDVKENSVGRFIKIRESDGGKGQKGGASKVILPSMGALSFVEALRTMSSPKINAKATSHLFHV